MRMRPKKDIFNRLWDLFEYQYRVFLSNSTLLAVALRMVLYESGPTPRSSGASAAATMWLSLNHAVAVREALMADGLICADKLLVALRLSGDGRVSSDLGGPLPDQWFGEKSP